MRYSTTTLAKYILSPRKELFNSFKHFILINRGVMCYKLFVFVAPFRPNYSYLPTLFYYVKPSVPMYSG